MKKGLIPRILTLTIILLISISSIGQVRRDNRVREYLTPKKVVWVDTLKSSILNIERLLQSGNGQSDLINNNLCELRNGVDGKSSIILDYGKELHGGLEIVAGRWGGVREKMIRIRFGESVSEVMADVGEGSTAKNDHAIRDMKVLIPWLGKKEMGNTGFRFVRIDFEDSESSIFLKEVNAISVYRDIPYLGSFECNDERLNQIWKTGAYTVHLNMQGFLWDGIKRDRLVWVGDLHPEVMTVNSVFGYNEVVPKSLDLIKANTPIPNWMNNISSYSMWWVLIHYDWYMYHGDLDYLKEQKEYMTSLLEHLCTMVDEEGKENLNGSRFLDWPSSPYPKAVDAGYHALLKMTLEKGAKICEWIGSTKTKKKCSSKVKLMKRVSPDPVNSKQAAALLQLSGNIDSKVSESILLNGGAKNFSTFYGYYMLQALSELDKTDEALQIVRDYWGGMIDLGATTFWEDFNLDWVEDATRIDEVPVEGRKDIHADCGAYCYVGLRHSFCHGWASGPTPWMTENVLGVKVLEPGCKKVAIEPNLGNLKWAKGTFPTPYGIIKIEHKTNKKGKIETRVDAPKEVKIVGNRQ